LKQKIEIFFSDLFEGKGGFTLIELLVVIAIIGLLGTIVLTALGNTRLKARDAKRVSDIKEIKTGMDLFFSHGNGYPSETDFNNSYLNKTQLSCGNTPIIQVTQDPLYPTHEYTYETSVTTVSNGCVVGGPDLYKDYTITFYLERPDDTFTMDSDGQFDKPLPF